MAKTLTIKPEKFYILENFVLESIGGAATIHLRDPIAYSDPLCGVNAGGRNWCGQSHRIFNPDPMKVCHACYVAAVRSLSEEELNDAAGDHYDDENERRIP